LTAGPKLFRKRFDTGAVLTVETLGSGFLPDRRPKILFVDGTLGRVARSALILFEQARGIPQTGEVDDPTWAKLQQSAATTP
jgi:peptidoglycan hydrolase-like protein with peptidoglycan-binding domain